MLFLMFLFHFFSWGGDSASRNDALMHFFSQGTYTGILEVLLGFPSSPDSTSIVLSRKSIAKALRKSRLGYTTPTFWKWPDARSVETSNTAIYQKKLRSGQNLVANVLYEEIGTCIQLLWFSAWRIYLKWSQNRCWYVNCFVSFAPLLSMKIYSAPCSL